MTRRPPASRARRVHVVEADPSDPTQWLGAKVAVEWSKVLQRMAASRDGKVSAEVVLVATSTMFTAYVGQIVDPAERKSLVDKIVTVLTDMTNEEAKKFTS